MAWKVEKWLADVYPGLSKFDSEYKNLSDRELAIVGGACIDLALAELISKRFVDIPNEYESFLGLNEDGRAPSGSFGARIQLALLLGLIREGDAEALRLIKKIRNRFSHRINTSFADPVVFKDSMTLLEVGSRKDMFNWKDGARYDPATLKKTREVLEQHPSATSAVFRSIFLMYQHYFQQLSGHVERIQRVRLKEKA